MKRTGLPLRAVAKQIYQAALAEVNPEIAIRKQVNVSRNVLKIGNRVFPLAKFQHIYVVGAGKAAWSMGKAIEDILGNKIKAGIVVVKNRHGEPLRRIKVLEAGHPEPDSKGLRGAQQIWDLLHDEVTKSDLVFFLFSGGASALIPLPAPGISLEDKAALNRLLLNSRATIREINAVRKHISRIKGGQLAQLIGRMHAITLVLSDVVGDDLSAIASGPTVPDNTTFQDCLGILEKYGLMEKIPPSIRKRLRLGAHGKISETPKQGNSCFVNKSVFIIGSNMLACQAAVQKARNLRFNSLILSSSIEGDTSEVANFHVAIAREVVRSGNPVRLPACIISGGETTLQVKGNGKGGRNQEFALHCAELIKEFPREIIVLSLGTDGTDGPTEAAGGIADRRTIARAQALGLGPLREYLERNDSYHFLKRLGDLIITGPTRTNVMDLRIVLIR